MGAGVSVEALWGSSVSLLALHAAGDRFRQGKGRETGLALARRSRLMVCVLVWAERLHLTSSIMVLRKGRFTPLHRWAGEVEADAAEVAAIERKVVAVNESGVLFPTRN